MPTNGLLEQLQQWIYTPKSGCSSAKNVVYLSRHLGLASKIVRLWCGSPWLCPLCRAEGLHLKPCPNFNVPRWYIHQGGLKTEDD